MLGYLSLSQFLELRSRKTAHCRLCLRTDIRAFFRAKWKLMEAIVFFIEQFGFCVRPDFRKAMFNRGIKQKKHRKGHH